MITNNQRISTLVTEENIIEALYDPHTETTRLAVYDGHEVRYQDGFDYGDQTLLPMAPDSDFLRKRVILLPSEAASYESDISIIEDIQRFVHKYVHISPEFEAIVPYYVLLTWVYEKFNELPYLRAIGDYGSGKTRFLQTVGSLCYKPIFTAGATTTAPIFRMIDRLRGTLIMDEADFRYSDMSADIIKILNSGYTKGFPVIRCEGKGVYEERTFDVFGPKILATRETFKDQALESRFLVEHMGQSKIRKGISRNLTSSFHEEALEIRNKLLMWRFNNYRKSVDLERESGLNLHPRLEQIAAPMMALIDSEEVRSQLLDFMKSYNRELLDDRSMSWESQVLEAIATIYKKDNKSEITVGEITKEVNKNLDVTDSPFEARRVGWILKSKLHLRTRKRQNGFCLSIIEYKNELIFKFERYGVENPFENEHLNVVNVDMPRENEL